MWRKIVARHRARHLRDGQSGVALLITISVLALLIALTSEFTYDTTIYSAQAGNARDEVRAHYLARSSIALSRLLVRIQKKFIDPVMSQAQKMFSSATAGATGAAAGSAPADLGISLRVTDYAGTLMGFFGGSKEEVESLGSLIGLDTSEAKGLGIKSGRMDAEIASEDGKIDINCGGGPSPQRDNQMRLFRMLSALTMSPRYNRLFEERNADGQFIDRMDLARALIDWSDLDQLGFSIEAGGGGAEDYRYDARKDPYRAHDGFYDTVGEVGLVRGMEAPFMEAFGDYLTVYASDPTQKCRVNLSQVKGDCTPLLVGIIRAALLRDPTKPPSDPSVLDDQRVYPLASILCERGSAVGFDSLDTIARVLANPAASIAREDPRYQLMQSMRGITISRADLEQVAYVGSPRVYRVTGTGESGKVKKQITAIIDTGRTPEHPVTNNWQSEGANGVIVYWREE